MKKLFLLIMMTLLTGSLCAQGTAGNSSRVSFQGMVFAAPRPCVMIGTYDAAGRPDVMMAIWGGQGGQGRVVLRLGEHMTTENLRLKQAFTLSFATEGTVRESDYLGTVSARDVPDKVARAGFTVHRAAQVDAPVIDQYPVTMECRVVSFEDGVLTGEVLATHADRNVVDAAGKIDMSLLRPLLYDSLGKVYRTIGGSLGKAWECGKEIK